MAPGTYVFRISQPEQLAVSQELHHATIYRTRRPHNKSRSGCTTCRKRRKKVIIKNMLVDYYLLLQCDETKPCCGYCLRQGKDCEYPNQFTPRDASCQPVHRLIWPGAKSPAVLSMSGLTNNHTDYDLFLLDHFQRVTARTFGPDWVQKIQFKSIIEIAMTHAHVMHGILALSACHMQHLGVEVSPYQNVEVVHSQNAVDGLRHGLSTLITTRDSDAVLATAMFLNGVTYCFSETRDAEGREPQNWNWLRIQIGLRSILENTRNWRENSIWIPLFSASEQIDLLPGPTPTSRHLSRLFFKLCSTDGENVPSDSPYAEPLENMIPLLTDEPNFQHTPQYLRWIGSMNLAFIDLLEADDPPAMALFSHWLANMSAVDMWWSTTRTKRECWRLCEKLENKLSLDMIDLLERPARSCGYKLRNFRKPRQFEEDGLLELFRL
jgi:hypothetical protein